MRPDRFMKTLALGAFVVVAALHSLGGNEKRPNILLMTADDMSFDSVGYAGCPLPGISPNLDKLRSESMAFEHAHIVTAICGPSRAAMHSGRYPHQSGAMGHGIQPPSWWKPTRNIPSVSSYLHQAGYRTGIICKGSGGEALAVTFDLDIGKAQTDVGRSPEKFYRHSKAFFEAAKESDQPFFLNANFCDPHGPWAREEGESWLEKERGFAAEVGYTSDIPEPKTRYSPDEIPVPPFLPDTPEMRRHIAPYFDSVNRMDECAGATLRALRESGLEENTIVVFLADHGIGVAFGKRSNYLYGTRTPLIVKWPGNTQAGATDDRHTVSTVDLAPTFFEAAGLAPLAGLDGRSLVPLLRGEKPRDWRETTYSAFNCMNGEGEYWPSRSMTGQRYVYVWNGWSDGKQLAAEVLHGGGENKEEARQKRWGDDATYGVVEEFYDMESDRGFWNNQIENPEHRQLIEGFREKLLAEMKRSKDPELENFENRGSGKARILYQPDRETMIRKELKTLDNKIRKSKVGSPERQAFEAEHQRLEAALGSAN